MCVVVIIIPERRESWGKIRSLGISSPGYSLGVAMFWINDNNIIINDIIVASEKNGGGSGS